MSAPTTPAHSPSAVPPAGDAGLPAPSGRPAIMPLHPRFARGVDVCAVIHGGNVEFVARDILLAAGLDVGDYAGDRSHDAPTSFTEHAAARTWSRDLLGDILAPLTDRPLVAELLFWLDGHIETLTTLGLDAVERKILHGTGHVPAAPTPEAAPGGPPLPQFYSIGAAARILSRDPGIGLIGRDSLFEQMHKLAWVERRGDTWKPARDLTIIGYLLTQHVAVPTRPTAYPQILITPFGIEALHQRLGGTTTLDLRPSDHLTLIEA